MYNSIVKTTQPLTRTEIVSQISIEFMENVFQMRKVKSVLKPKVSAEILIYLDMLIISKMNERFPVSRTVSVAKNNLKEICENIGESNMKYNDFVRMATIRQEFYRTGVIELGENENFLRTVGMQWFQFPFQDIDGSIQPSKFDFSVYFSDNYLVAEILFDLAPQYAERIVSELERRGDNTIEGLLNHF